MCEEQFDPSAWLTDWYIPRYAFYILYSVEETIWPLYNYGCVLHVSEAFSNNTLCTRRDSRHIYIIQHPDTVLVQIMAPRLLDDTINISTKQNRIHMYICNIGYTTCQSVFILLLHAIHILPCKSDRPIDQPSECVCVHRCVRASVCSGIRSNFLTIRFYTCYWLLYDRLGLAAVTFHDLFCTAWCFFFFFIFLLSF